MDLERKPPLVTEKQWEIYLKKYERLMWAISHRISRDYAIADLETNFADLVVAALESVKGYKKKTGFAIDDFLETDLFGKYTKTVLWNCKNKKGSGIKKREEINYWSISLDAPRNIQTVDTTAYTLGDLIPEKSNCFAPVMIRDFTTSLSEEQQELLQTIVNTPSVFFENGSLNIRELSRLLDKPYHQVYFAVIDLQNEFQLTLIEE